MRMIQLRIPRKAERPCRPLLKVAMPSEPRARARDARVEPGRPAARVRRFARELFTGGTSTPEWAWFQTRSPSLGLGVEGGCWLPFISRMEKDPLEGMVEPGDRLQPSGERRPFLDGGLRSLLSPAVTLPLTRHCVSALHPLKSGTCHRG